MKDFADLGARACAYIIDWQIKAVLCLITFMLLVVLGQNWAPLNPEIALSTQLAPFFAQPTILLPFLVYVIYQPLIEIIYLGSSPGKKIAGIVVLNQDDTIASRRQHLLRNLCRFWDGIPLIYGVGALSCLFSKERLRLGDKLSRTKVVYA